MAHRPCWAMHRAPKGDSCDWPGDCLVHRRYVRDYLVGYNECGLDERHRMDTVSIWHAGRAVRDPLAHVGNSFCLSGRTGEIIDALALPYQFPMQIMITIESLVEKRGT